LTARHVVEDPDQRCEVRPLGTIEWMAATVEWRGATCDAALLKAPTLDGWASARLGRLGTDGRAECRSLGFPLAQARDRVRDTEEVVGHVIPLAARKSGLLTVHVEGSVPEQDASGHSPWEGISGAALFCGSLLVGVLAVDPAHFGTDRLEAVPVAAMAAESGFRAAIGIASPGLLDAVEDEPARNLLTPAYAPLPVNASPEFLRRSPVHLCLPQYGIVPFRGRAAELAELARWLDGSGFTMALLIGGGGMGKTRLAAEVCQSALAAGWLAGFLDEEAGDMDVLVSGLSPLLLVVDEAQTRLDELASLIAGFATNGQARPIRLLLLSREAGEWWDTTLPARLERNVETALALDGARRLDLGPLPAGIDRLEAFRQSVRAFADRTDRDAERLGAPDLTEELFERVLFIHLAALTALEGGPMPHGSLVRAELLDARIAQEMRYWQGTARDAGLDSLDARTLQRAVALSTLAPSVQTEADAAALLGSVPDLADEGEGPRRRTALWLRSLYPGDGFLRPLQPDLLGEHLVSRVLADVPELVENLIAMITQDQARRPLTVLARAARTDEAAAGVLGEALTRHLPSVGVAAIDVALETGGPIGALLTEALNETPSPELAEELLDRVPYSTVALREFAVIAARQAVDHASDLPAGLERDEATGRLLNNLSTRLAELGRDDEALAAIQRAVLIFRHLSEVSPDEFVPRLHQALLNLSNSLADAGRLEEALDAIDEVLKSDTITDEQRSGALYTLSTRLYALDRTEEALRSLHDAIPIYQRLAETHPSLFLPNLAMVSATRSLYLDALGRRQEALQAIDDSLRVYRRLVATAPDAYLPDLAESLHTRSITLMELERYEEALDTIDEAIAIYRQLAPFGRDFLQPKLANAFYNRSIYLSMLGLLEEALATIEEAVPIYERLTQDSPNVYLLGLLNAAYNRSAYLANLGRYEQALTSRQEALDAIVSLLDRSREQPDGAIAGQILQDHVILSADFGGPLDDDLRERISDALKHE
jgi:tetratricopeptide (TPR) repeat protein